jgi:hypothetical protein
MCANRKQWVNRPIASIAAAAALLGNAIAGGEAGGVAIGEGHGGVADEAFVLAPPFYLFVVEKEPGSFLDCGEGQETRKTDEFGRDAAALSCGVSLTETIVIPAASVSARIIIHF